MNKKTIRNTFLELLIIFLLSYPLFYFAYKSSVPSTLGHNDYGEYYLLYDNWEFGNVESPYNMRLISTYLTHLLVKLNIYYDTEINYTNSENNKIVFFNVLLFNYLALIATVFFVYKLIKYRTGDKFYSFAFGLFYFFSFGTLFFTISPLTDALSGLLVVWCFYNYIKESNLIIIPLFSCIFQREYVLLIFILIPLIKIIFDKSFNGNKYHLLTIVFSTIYFCIYFILRKTFFYTDDWNYQIQISGYIHNISISITYFFNTLKHSLINQNLFTIYLFLVVIKFIKQKPINKLYFLTVILLFFQSIFIGIMLQLGNNSARIFNFVTPIIIYYVAEEFFAVFVNRGKCINRKKIDEI